MSQLNDPGTKQPCPNCGSTRVVWRNRRFTDVVATYLRWVADRVAAVALGGVKARSGRPGYSDESERARLDALTYARERYAYEDGLGTMTADRFWRCPDCRQKGAVFGHLDGVLRERAHLIKEQQEIEANLGIVSNPLDETSPHGRE